MLSILFVACGGGDAEEQTSNETTEESTDDNEGTEESSNVMDPRTHGGEKNTDQMFMDDSYPVADKTVDQILGSYVGAFGKNMINITLFKAENGVAEGYSVCAGNFRKIQGTFDLMQGQEYIFEMDEPGTDKYDGKFEFTLDASINEINGKWTPFKEEGNSFKKYNLNKSKFIFNANNGNYPEASKRELTDDDLYNLGEDELAEMRNEIYARHGYSFKNKDWRYHFEALDWYMPMGVDIRDKLSDVEVNNIELIYEYEDYLSGNYDDYGR